MPPVLVTGAAGFIGYHVAAHLLADGREVVGADSFTDYYAPALKEARFGRLSATPGFTGVRIDLSDLEATRRLFAQHGFAEVIHLAAQPGVRYALTHPEAYAGSNLTAFLSILEACRHGQVAHLVYASSSSVYGADPTPPFSERAPVDHPISLYAATKRANELMAHSYAHLFGLPTTGLRFFTVYGPFGRPDMAVYRFTDLIARGETIDVADGGRVRRDFTYVDDVVEGVVRVLQAPPAPRGPERTEPSRPDSGAAPFRIFNIGGDRTADLNTVIGLIEASLGLSARRRDIPLPPGDIAETRADTTELVASLGYVPATTLEMGIPRFVAWYRAHHADPA